MMQYVAWEEIKNGDSNNMKFTPDKAKAFDDAEYWWSHLTERERKVTEISVRGWDVPEGMTFEEWTDEMCWLPDCVFFEVVK